MSLLVGVLCEDGVVVGSTGSGPTTTARPGRFEERSTYTLLPGRDLILAGTGRSGLGQRFADAVATVRSDSRFTEWNALSIAKTICAEAVDDFAITRCDKGQFAALLAFPARDGFQLCEFAASDLQPELKTPDRWFAAVGAGRPAAAPFLEFFSRTLFAASRPVLDEGVFAATWALDYAVGSISNGTTGALQIGVLAREAPDMPFRARLLSREELSDWLARVRAAERHLAGYRESLSGRVSDGDSH